MELDFDVMKRKIKYTFIVSLSGIAFPFVISIGSSWAVYTSLEKNNTYSFGIFLLFMGVAMSITAFPVLARIIKESQLSSTDLGVVTISTAAWDDVAAWILLALSIGLATGGAAMNALWSFLLLIGYCVLMFTVGRIVLAKIYITKGRARELTPFLFASLFLLILINSWLTEYFGLHAIFGAFIFGVVLPREDHFVIKFAEKFEDFVICFLLPLYFALSGLRTKIDLINSGNVAGLMLLLICVASVSKITGGLLSAKLIGLSWRQSLTLGVLMNCKGLVEIIVLNIGLDNGIINEQVFTMMVVMAIITTFITSPAVRVLYPISKIAMYESKRQGSGSITLCIKYTTHVNFMLNFASLLTKDADKKFNLYAVRSIGNQERPSAYMTKPENDEILSFVTDSSKSLDMTVKPLLATYDNSKKDCAKKIVNIANSKKTEYLLLAWKIEEQDLEDGTLGSSMIELISHYSESKAVVLVEKPGITFPTSIKEIVFVYSGTKHDVETTRFIRMILKDDKRIKLTIINVIGEKSAFNPNPHKDHLVKSLLKLPRSSVIDIDTAEPTEAIMEVLSQKSKRSVCMVGTDIEWEDVVPRGVNYRKLVTEVNRPFVVVSDCITYNQQAKEEPVEAEEV